MGIKLTIITAMWRRHDVFRIWCEAITEAISKAPFEVSVVVAGSEGEISQGITESFGFGYVEVANNPLSNKFNAAAIEAQKSNPDYVLILGSDNIICPRYLHHFKNAMKQGTDLIGHLDSYVIDMMTDRAKYWPGYRNHRQGEPAGSGRFYHKRLLKKLGGKIWPDGINMSLDFFALKRIEGKPRGWPETTTNKRPIKHTRKIFKLDKIGVFHGGFKSTLDKNPFAGNSTGRMMNKKVLIERHLSKRVAGLIREYPLTHIDTRA